MSRPMIYNGLPVIVIIYQILANPILFYYYFKWCQVSKNKWGGNRKKR